MLLTKAFPVSFQTWRASHVYERLTTWETFFNLK